MNFSSQYFLVIATPSLETTRLDVTENVKRQLRKHFDSVATLYEVTQIIDDDLGDCFLVSMLLQSDNEELVQLYPNVTEWMGLELSNAEVWVTGNDPFPLAPAYGWKQSQFWCENQDSSNICDKLHEYGLAFISAVDHSQDNFFSKARELLKADIQVLESAVTQHYPHIRLGESAFGFQEYTHRGPQRFEILLKPDSELCQLLRCKLEPHWKDSVQQYLGTNRLRLNISCVYSRPGSTDQEWHTDGGHYGANPYALCIFVPLVPLTHDTGFTRFWPKTHRCPHLLGLGAAAETLKTTIDGVDLQPGSAILYDYRTWHRGTENRTSDVERPVIQFLYSCEWYKERNNYGTTSVFETPNRAGNK